MKDQIRKEKLEHLEKYFRRRKYISILLALFTLGVNIFAWFAFSADVGVSLDASVSSWDVEFKSENEIITRHVQVDVTDMKPGMNTFNKTIEIESKSDVQASFTYSIIDMTLLGQSIPINNQADPYNYLETHYPFVISISADKTVLQSSNDTITFEINIDWDYDTTPPVYFQQNDTIYGYNSTFTYYTQSGGVYTPVNIATPIAFASQRNNLYLIKDDADTYFGMSCGVYENANDLPCLSINMNLLVEQINS